MKNTLAEAGFYMPAEWEKHEGTWLQGPQDKVYRSYELKLEGMWLAMVDALHQHENAHVHRCPSRASMTASMLYKWWQRR